MKDSVISNQMNNNSLGYWVTCMRGFYQHESTRSLLHPSDADISHLQVTTLPVSPCERCHLVAVRVYFYPQHCSSIVPSEIDCFSSVTVSQLTVANNTAAPLPLEENT